MLYSLLLAILLGLLLWGVIAFALSEGEVHYNKVDDYDFDITEHENYWRGYDGHKH